MTVATYPKAVFCVAASLLITAVSLLGGIRAKGMKWYKYPEKSVLTHHLQGGRESTSSVI
jgi:hypothetical protein